MQHNYKMNAKENNNIIIVASFPIRMTDSC